MHLTIKECGSTSTELKRIIASGRWLANGSTIRAISQTAGRGQRGNSWEAEPGKNLTFSILLRPGGLLPQHHFLVSEAIAIAVNSFVEALLEEDEGPVRIKWPNDIYVGDRKIAGILIENTLGSNGDILQTIAGIGININQEVFTSDAPNPISIKNITGLEFDLDQLLSKLAPTIAVIIDNIAPMVAIGGAPLQNFEKMYHDRLWRADDFYDWRDTASGTVFKAKIDRVMPNGQLILRLPDDNKIGYMFKEVEAVL